MASAWAVSRGKRVVDLVGAGTALVAVAPLMGAVAATIWLVDGGPVTFQQARAGQHGRGFSMIKFRSMRVGAQEERPGLQDRNEADEPAFKLRDDPRVTRLGHWLRRTSLDELPQLLHVLRGEMSLVGPRPAALDEVEAWRDDARRRLEVRPGMTGIWQVSGRSELDGATWLRMDLRYVDEATLALDLALLLRTLPAVLSGRGAW